MASIATVDYVAMVQTAMFLPMALLALPAGAIADIYDRRRVQLLFFTLGLLATAALITVGMLGMLTPWRLLGLCSLVGTAGALATPARGASVAEQVPSEQLPQAIALNNISYNLARTVGPALGGMLVAVYGGVSAFVINAFCYLPVLESLRRWQRVSEESRLPPEGLLRSISAGVAYIANMSPVRRAIVRVLVSSMCVAVLHALMPLIARDLLEGDARTFGALLGAYGVGAVTGVLLLQRVRRYWSNEATVASMSLAVALTLVVIAFSRNIWVDLAVLFIAGAASMIMSTTISITVQLFVPRWVMGRAIATSSAAMSLGVAVGSWFWGQLAMSHGLVYTFLWAAALLVGSMALGWVIPVADRDQTTESDPNTHDNPDVQLAINGRSGPITVELEYRIAADRARDFYKIMREIHKSRLRSGAYGWSISRDLADVEVWCERFRFPTWHDYLRMRSRRTREDSELFSRASTMHIGLEPVRIQRWLDRPFGSVRWQESTPDRGDVPIQVSS
jgi:predicted MFS family arabinose efflux permease